ncbi:pilus assembly PilX N-terminal domain-containing protein [Dyella jiangningensis]|uniref:type IV pilus modification PilV family protein n=1 Tax=Dyella jiangningensis TaxID=1379159 RepID=UPI00240F95CC|nr:pilus assembly PilX N-terminal domain-containing protein [Dyella jiangningensis]MDG2540080.1 pilus assembly PilX N-terminal domain-containing protein [Dyella jiangningensis]
MNSFGSQVRQGGFTLVTTLVFLVIFLIFAISMAGSSMVNTKVVSNQQFRLEAKTVAQQGIEQVLSQPFTAVPITSVTPVQVDVNGDNKPDFIAQVDPPVCTGTKPVLNQDLDATNPNDIGCMFSGSGQNTGILLPNGGAVPGPPCQATQWDVKSSVTDPTNTAASVTVHQGVAVRALAGATCP